MMATEGCGPLAQVNVGMLVAFKTAACSAQSKPPCYADDAYSFVAHMRLSYQETSDGEVRHVSAGDSVLVDDAHGKGPCLASPCGGEDPDSHYTSGRP
jgi:hypothetical protein